MVLVFVVATVASVVGYPNLLNARKHQNESRAIKVHLRSIATAQTMFREGDREHDGSLDYGTLAELATAGLIDEALGSGTKDGYVFVVQPSPTTGEFLWWATASPVRPGQSGDRWFAANQSGVIRYTTAGPIVVNPATTEIPLSALAVCGCGCSKLPVGRVER